MTRNERIARIAKLCKDHGCSDKIRKIHFEQFVDRQWHPHPPEVYLDWIHRHPDYQFMINQGTTVREAEVKTFNCARFYDQFCEARKLGFLEETPKSTFG